MPQDKPKSSIPMSVETAAQMHRWSNNLHHLTMLYLGGIAELGRGQQLLAVGKNEPGAQVSRDILDLILIMRAEINGLTKVLVDAGIVTNDQLGKEFSEQYEWLAKAKASQFGVEVTDVGLTFKKNVSGN